MEGRGSGRDGPVPWGLGPEQKPLVFPGLGEGAAGERRGRSEGGALLGLPHPYPAPRKGSGPQRGALEAEGEGAPRQ